MKTALEIRGENPSNWRAIGKPTVGKDILELLSSSMYIEPLTIYREYIQNAADSIDEARDAGLYRKGLDGQVSIEIDQSTRTIKIRDTGIGVRSENFESQLGTFGSSLKRGTARRGFRGVGRLAGLGYCQQLIFRTRAVGEKVVSEMLWDCRKIKQLLRTSERHWTLEAFLAEVVSVRRLPGAGEPKHFFEVEMKGVIRHKNDMLLNRQEIYGYLAEVAPVPFHPMFDFGQEVLNEIRDVVAMGVLEINIQGEPEPVYRPYRQAIYNNGVLFDTLSEIEIHRLPSLDEGLGAVLWIAHHSYKGTVPDKRVRGVRVRSGNVQIGEHSIFSESFPEPRFNSWSVAEVHVIDPRIVPNGRRDHFEMGVHFDNLVNQLTPHLRRIATQCRKNSAKRNRIQAFDRIENLIHESLDTLATGVVSKTTRLDLITRAVTGFSNLSKLASFDGFDEKSLEDLSGRLHSLDIRIKDAQSTISQSEVLVRLPKSKREAYERILRLILECSDDEKNGIKLVNLILGKLEDSVQ